MDNESNQPPPEELVESKPKGETLRFKIDGIIHRITAPVEGDVIIANITIYNPTKPLLENGQEHLLGRIESLERENDSEMVVFNYNSEENAWELDENGPNFKDFQDPFYCGEFIEKTENGETKTVRVIGGVQIAKDESGNIINWKTSFYKYENSLDELKGADPFASGTDQMKGIRPVQLEDEIGVFVRPQEDGGFGGLGKIGYFNINELGELNDALKQYSQAKDPATLIEGLFGDQEWGGANEIHKLKNGKLGVLCHKANMVEGDKKDYVAAAFVFDPKTKEHTPLEIIATADDFEPIPPKKSDLRKVIYPGGLIRNDDGTAWLYAGIGDVKAGKILIADPFAKYEA
jgi:hypothetical protein